MSGISETEIIKFLIDKRKSLITEIEKIDVALSAIKGVDFAAIPKDISSLEEASVPDTYSSKLKLDKKILFVIRELKSGDKSEIIDKIKELEPETDVVKLEKSISVRLSYLKNNNLIQADKNGRSLRYFL
ncbi:hypothetical protein [Belliella aquatica]|uniref:ArsR family transcriptional regulator n=1 Tax=Belliella aquatica TaxID=1323734 RepID=A0ABQ1M4W5_9BACT|nr:hypothetical protein [Belliella aquatica]MCH7404956.1 hypothetical protein [Belliella aquatica]GGC32794.1 hypothetical protein GCM10010993_09610 [Belliella aquatica]